MYKQTTLPNGLKFITVPMQGTKTATILVIIKTGSKYENKKNNGISHFLEHMFFKGTKKRPNTLAIAGELDGVGGEYNAFTTKEYTGYWVKVDSSKIGLAADIVSDMLINSKFDSVEINREKGVIIEEVNMYHDNPMMYIEDVFEQCLYGNTPAGWEIIGPKKNIYNFSRKDFMDYFNSQYSADNTIICVAGNIKNGVKEILKKYLKKFNKRNFKDKEPVRERQVKPNIKVHYKKTNQTTVSLGVRTYPIGHQDEFIVKFMSVILGGSMSSRLFTNLRERNGLAYYVKTQSEFYTDTGYLTTQAGVPIEKLEKAIKIILGEYKKLVKILVNKKELDRTKDLIRGRSTIQLESSDNTASYYARQAVLRDKVLTPEEFFKKIESITLMDIKRVAADIFVNKGLNLALIGPFKDEKKFVKVLNL